MKGSVVTHSLIGVLRSSDVESAARLMVKEDIGALGIYDLNAHELIGILSERDIVRAVAEGRVPATTSVTDLMTKELIVTDAPIPADGARELMNAKHVRHLVVRENGGDHIVSLRDV